MENQNRPEENGAGDWKDLFEAFVLEKQYLKGATPKTVKSYRDAWRAFNHYGKAEMTEQGVKNFMVETVKAGRKPGASNAFARSLNSFFTWLHENGHTKKRLKIPLRKAPKRVLRTYKAEEVERILSYAPKTFVERRLLALLALLIDTGARINEALTLERSGIDFDELLVTFYGKGDKERRVPISPTCQKILVRWLKEHKFNLVFCANNGNELWQDNVRRDFRALLKKVGVEKSEGVFHTFRRYFAKEYVRNGGNVLYLQKMLGHATLDMSKRYMELDTDDLTEKHRTASPLKRLIDARKAGQPNDAAKKDAGIGRQAGQ